MTKSKNKTMVSNKRNLQVKVIFFLHSNFVKKFWNAVALVVPMGLASKQNDSPFSTIRKKHLGISPLHKKSGPVAVLAI